MQSAKNYQNTTLGFFNLCTDKGLCFDISYISVPLM